MEEWNSLQDETRSYKGPPKDNAELERRTEHKARIKAFLANLTKEQRDALVQPKTMHPKDPLLKSDNKTKAVESKTKTKASTYYRLHPKPHPVKLGWTLDEKERIFFSVLCFSSHTKRFPMQKYEETKLFGNIDRRVFSNLYEDDKRVRIAPLLEQDDSKEDFVKHKCIYDIPACSTEHLFQAIKCLYEWDARFILEELNSNDARNYGQSRMILNERQKDHLVTAGASPEDFMKVVDKNGMLLGWKRGVDGCLPRRDDWKAIKHLVMLHLVRAKFGGRSVGSCARQAVEALMRLPAIPLFVKHTENDSEWADFGNGKGTNYLGKCLTQVFLEMKGQATPVPIRRCTIGVCALEVPNSEIVSYESVSLKDEVVPSHNEEAILSPDYSLVLDFEAICETGRTPRPQEIIEWPTLMLNIKTGEVEAEFHHYIRPELHPLLSKFCTDLTGITQSQVNKGLLLEEAMKQHASWLEENGLVSLYDKDNQTRNDRIQKTYLYLTCGDWDLKSALPNQLKYHEKSVPPNFGHWINIKFPFQDLYHTRARGMTSMLEHLGLALEGRHHSGIDDCRNIARICQIMLNDGWSPICTSTRI
jgi:inhibitor of KinA sporulation pathway (predicted exonuclease)